MKFLKVVRKERRAKEDARTTEIVLEEPEKRWLKKNEELWYFV